MIGENEDIQAWEKNLFRTIKNVSDNDFQNKTWLGKDPRYISSFSDVISDLYDVFDLPRYINYHESTAGKDTLHNLLSELDQMINKYEAVETDELILADSKWIEITNKAKEICLLLDKRDLLRI